MISRASPLFSNVQLISHSVRDVCIVVMSATDPELKPPLPVPLLAVQPISQSFAVTSKVAMQRLTDTFLPLDVLVAPRDILFEHFQATDTYMHCSCLKVQPACCGISNVAHICRVLCPRRRRSFLEPTSMLEAGTKVNAKQKESLLHPV